MAMSEAVLDEMLKFLEDMDDEELASRKVNVNIEMAQIQLEMAKMQ